MMPVTVLLLCAAVFQDIIIVFALPLGEACEAMLYSKIHFLREEKRFSNTFRTTSPIFHEDPFEKL